MVIKKKKTAGFTTREQFENAVDRMAVLSVEVQRMEAELKAAHQRIDDEGVPPIKVKKAEIDALFGDAERYFLANEKALCNAGAKSGETRLALFGVRIGLPTVVKKTREAWKSVAARWASIDHFKRWVRATPEVDKEKILATFRDERAVAEQTLLASEGFTVEQEPREFWVKPRADEQVG